MPAYSSNVSLVDHAPLVEGVEAVDGLRPCEGLLVVLGEVDEAVVEDVHQLHREHPVLLAMLDERLVAVVSGIKKYQ